MKTSHTGQKGFRVKLQKAASYVRIHIHLTDGHNHNMWIGLLHGWSPLPVLSVIVCLPTHYQLFLLQKAAQ